MTIIRYEIPKKTKVTLEIYNVVGQLVKALVDQVQEPGYYETALDGTGMASGVYFCRLYAGGYRHITKMVLLK